MSIKTLFLAGVTSLALCAGAQAQQVANVAGQTNVAVVGQGAYQGISQSGSGNLGLNLQSVDQDVRNVNLGAAVNLGGGGYSSSCNSCSGQYATVQPQTNVAIVDQKALQGIEQTRTGTGTGSNFALNAQAVNQAVTNANVGIAANVRFFGAR